MRYTLLSRSALVMAILLPLAAGAPSVLRGAGPPRGGVYTEAQADEGQAIYEAQCAMCHGARLEGTYEVPELKGRFVTHWSNAPVSTLTDYIRVAMPQMAPGSLSLEDSAKLTAFLLRANGMPAGPNPLPQDMATLKSIPFVPALPAR